MPSNILFVKRFDNWDQVLQLEKMRLGKLVAAKARKAVQLMEASAPKSDKNEAGYVHFRDQFEAQQVAPFIWQIVNLKMVGKYPLWKLLEYGTRKMAPRKTIGPVMDLIGPELLKEAGEFERSINR